MRHRGTKESKPGATHGYAWYDPDTGAVNLCHLATDATRSATTFETPPAWILAADIPQQLPEADPLDLARLEARARRAFVRSES